MFWQPKHCMYLHNLANISTVWKSHVNWQVNDFIVELSDYNLATIESISCNQYLILTDSILWNKICLNLYVKLKQMPFIHIE